MLSASLGRSPRRETVAASILAIFPVLAAASVLAATSLGAQAAPRPGQPIGAVDPRNAKTEKPPLHARHWLAITGKPLSATAGAQIFTRGGNAVDAAVAMLAAGCTMSGTLSVVGGA